MREARAERRLRLADPPGDLEIRTANPLVNEGCPSAVAPFGTQNCRNLGHEYCFSCGVMLPSCLSVRCQIG